jgi:hypothetical protein
MTVPHRSRIATLLLVTAYAAATYAASSGPSSTVVYVGGNDLVLKSSSGKVLNYTGVPASYSFTDGGKAATLAQLKPGDKLTAPVDTGMEPMVVASVAVVKTKVFSAVPPDGLTISSPEGAMNVTVPAGTKFMVDGKTVGYGDLSSGTMIEATIVTPVAEGEDPASAPATPPLAGSLLVAKVEALPATGTRLPLYGVLGGALLLAGFATLLCGRGGRCRAFYVESGDQEQRQPCLAAVGVGRRSGAKSVRQYRHTAWNSSGQQLSRRAFNPPDSR